jgi:hypothetical protein
LGAKWVEGWLGLPRLAFVATYLPQVRWEEKVTSEWEPKKFKISLDAMFETSDSSPVRPFARSPVRPLAGEVGKQAEHLSHMNRRDSQTWPNPATRGPEANSLSLANPIASSAKLSQLSSGSPVPAGIRQVLWVWDFILILLTAQGTATWASIVLLAGGFWTTNALAGILPPLAITAQYHCESFRPGSTLPFLTHELRLHIYSSNRWWRIRTEPSDGKQLPVDWMSIPGGARRQVDVPIVSTATNLFPVAEAYGDLYPLSLDAGVLLAWLACIPRPELPVLDDLRIHRFLGPGLEVDSRSEGTFGLEWLAPQLFYLARLSITNNGWMFLAGGEAIRAKGRLAEGWLEFEYRVKTITNWLGVTIPVVGDLQMWMPADDSTTRLALVRRETIQVINVRPLETADLPRFEYPIAAAMDRRPPGFAKGRALRYLITNDQWVALNDSRLRNLAYIERLGSQPQTTRARFGFVSLLMLLLLCPPAFACYRRLKHGYSPQSNPKGSP